MHPFYLLLIGLLCFFPSSLYSQEEGNGTKETEVYLQILPPKGTDISKQAKDILYKRLKEAVILNGLQANSSPYVLETQVLLLACTTTTSAPIQFIAEVEISCFITDRIRQRIVQQTSFGMKGIAPNKEKAVLKAVMQLNARQPQLKKLILSGKEKILSSLKSNEPDPEASNDESQGTTISPSVFR